MYRFVIPFLILVTCLAVLALVGWVAVQVVQRQRRKNELADDLEAEIRKFNSEVSLDDLRRLRDRINEDQERYRRDRDSGA